MRKLALAALLSVLGVGPAFAWGDEGHKTICQIAFDTSACDKLDLLDCDKPTQLQ